MNEKVVVEKKRIRGSNFTPEEELELVQNIINYQHIIESKELNASTRNEKDAAWNQIGQIFNSKFAPRTILQLRSKYDNMKTLARRFIAEKRNNFNSFNTGNNIRSNIAMNIILTIVRKPENSLDNVIDCNPEDIHFSEESSSYSDNSSKPVPITNDNRSFDDFEIKVKTEEESTENNYFSDKNDSIDITPIKIIKPIIIHTPAEINKTLERNKTLIIPDVSISQPNHENNSDSSNNKTRVVKKYKNNKFQAMLRVKTEYIKRKMNLLELENEERVKRMKRDEEMYTMKMKIMMLDISIKEQELKNLQNVQRLNPRTY